MKKINILETTLRDGSYAINFTFSKEDTYEICKALEEAGFELIEIGHGVGLGGSAKGYGKAIATDEEYLQAAKDALTTAKFGMFCIPGIAELEDIDLAAKYGMGFIRVGTNVTDVTDSELFIKRAKEHGMFVAANYMKSYAMDPEEFAQQVLLSEKYGADMVYIVDSSGGMFPEQIEEYYKAIRKVSKIPIGFHGHNNLGMAMANSLKAIELGIEYVDSSMQGLGRSSGNTVTEQLVGALQKKNLAKNIDFLKVLDISENVVRPKIEIKGHSRLDIVCGFADFHSSYMHHIRKYSEEYNVNPLKLIIEITKIDKVNVDVENLKEIAKKVQKEDKLKLENKLKLEKFYLKKYPGGEQEYRKKNEK